VDLDTAAPPSTNNDVGRLDVPAWLKAKGSVCVVVNNNSRRCDFRILPGRGQEDYGKLEQLWQRCIRPLGDLGDAVQAGQFLDSLSERILSAPVGHRQPESLGEPLISLDVLS